MWASTSSSMGRPSRRIYLHHANRPHRQPSKAPTTQTSRSLNAKPTLYQPVTAYPTDFRRKLPGPRLAEPACRPRRHRHYPVGPMHGRVWSGDGSGGVFDPAFAAVVLGIAPTQVNGVAGAGSCEGAAQLRVVAAAHRSVGIAAATTSGSHDGAASPPAHQDSFRAAAVRERAGASAPRRHPYARPRTRRDGHDPRPATRHGAHVCAGGAAWRASTRARPARRRSPVRCPSMVRTNLPSASGSVIRTKSSG